MIEIIFPRQFFGVIDPPNKEEVLDVFGKDDYLIEGNCKWDHGQCRVKTEYFSVEKVASVLQHAIRQFFNEFFTDFNKNFKRDTIELNLKIPEIWRNTYEEGYFQEIHDHFPHDIAAVIFLDDPTEGSAEFYFFDNHQTEVTPNWRDLIFKNSQRNIMPPKGSFLFFPGHVMHGVSFHKLNTIRRTVSFNINLK